MKNKTTAKHFEIFKTECQKWIEIFGLKGWQVIYDHVKMDRDTIKADCNYSVIKRHCEIRLNTSYPHKVSNDSIRRDAFHEVCELFIGELVTLAEYRYSTKDEIEEQAHAIIRTLENVLWEKK